MSHGGEVVVLPKNSNEHYEVRHDLQVVWDLRRQRWRFLWGANWPGGPGPDGPTVSSEQWCLFFDSHWGIGKGWD